MIQHKKIYLFYFIFTNLNLHNQLTTYFVLILLKGSNINQHMWSLTVSFGPIMFQKCWFSFFTSCSNFAIAQSSIGQLTKSWTFLKSTLNGLWKNVQLLLSRPSECREIKNQKALTVLRDTLYKFSYFLQFLKSVLKIYS